MTRSKDLIDFNLCHQGSYSENTLIKVDRGLILRYKQNIVLEAIPEGQGYCLLKGYDYLKLKGSHATILPTQDVLEREILKHQRIRMESLTLIRSHKKAIATIAKYLIYAEQFPIFRELPYRIISDITFLTYETVARNLNLLIEAKAINGSNDKKPLFSTKDLNLLKKIGFLKNI